MSHAGEFKAIVIGAGAGGLTVAAGLAGLGHRVALVEARAIGGDCTNVGCIPSKTLIDLARRNVESGAALAEVRRRRDHLRAEETRALGTLPSLEIVRGRATLLDSRRVRVVLPDDSWRMLRASNIVIATGSRPRSIAIPGLPAERTLTNENLFDLPHAPRHLAIVGAGPVGVEMAFAFRDLGSRVSLITDGRCVLSRDAADASAIVRDALSERGVTICFESSPARYDATTGTLLIRRGAHESSLEDVDQVLLAVGRAPNVGDLGLDHAGVRCDPDRGIPTDSAGATNIPGIYAVGDVREGSQWTHSADAIARRVVQRIALPWLPAPRGEPVYPHTTFSDPEVAAVGLTPSAIARRYHPGLVRTFRIELQRTDRGYTEGLTRGYIEAHALRLSGRVLGATVVGLRASELIVFWTLVIQERISLYRLFRLVYQYPTLLGGAQRIADTFLRETLPHLPRELGAVMRCGLLTLWGRLRGVRFESIALPQADDSLRDELGVGVA